MSGDVFRLFNEGVTASLNAQRARQQGDHAAASRFEIQAAELFDRVIALDPRHAGALWGKGLCFAQLGRTAEAVALFQRAVGAEPGHAENHRQLGLCHAELGDIGAARVAIRRAVDLDGRAEYRQHAAIELYNFGGHVMRLAAGHRDAGRRDEEQRCYRHARGLFSLVLDIEPGNQYAVRALSVVDQCMGGPAEPGAAADRGRI
jgi:tetratricopeptide (TPR) repeat protein